MSIYLVTKATQVVLMITGVFSPERRAHGQRVLFLSGFSAACVKEGILEADTLATLNRSLSVANNQLSLGIGVQLSTSLWPNGCITAIMKPVVDNIIDKGVRKYPTLTEANYAADEILKKTPHWLQYDLKEMHLDILDLLCDNTVSYS